MAIRFIGDTHFNHKNIIAYTSRDEMGYKGNGEPYSEVKEMNEDMVKRWNEVVSPDDIVYHVGDFGFGNSAFVEYLPRLNGHIYLILGNHDPRKSQQWYLDKGFEKVYDHSIILDDWFIVSHRPIPYLTERMPYINIHGHTHDECFSNPQRVNVSWEILKGYPITFEEIKSKFNGLELLSQITKTQDKVRHDKSMDYNKGYLEGYTDGMQDEKNKVLF